MVLMFVFVGGADAGERAIAPFRAIASPYGEMVAPMPYPAIYELTAEAGEPASSTTRSVFLDVLDDGSADAILAAFAGGPEGTMIQIRAFGGAMGRVAVDATAFPHRAASAQVTIISALGDPTTHAAALAWNRSLFDALHPKASGVYVNFLEDEGEERVREAYPNGAFERLALIKRRYDPANVFRRNQNVRPA